MTPFTDEDLRKLKEIVDDENGESMMRYSWSQLEALLARLEAAEEVIEKCSWHSTECKVHQAWRKAAGK